MSLELIPLFLSKHVQTWNASQPLNMSAWPEGLANQLSITDFTAGILLSAIFIIVFVLPMALWERRGIFGKLIVGVITLGFCVAVNWLPTYFLIIITLLIAVMLAGVSRKWIGG